MNSDGAIIRRLFTYIWPHRMVVALALFCGVVTSGFDAGLTYALKQALDALQQKSMAHLTPVFFMVAGLFLGNMLFRFTRNYLLRSTGEKCVAKIREEVFARLVGMPSAFFEKQAGGQISSRLLFDATALPSAMEGLGYYVSAPLSLLWLILVAFSKDWKLTLFAFLAAPAIMLVFKTVGASVRRNSHRTNEAMGEISVVLQELIQGIRTVKIFGAERALLVGFRSKSLRALKSTIKMIYVQELASPATEFIMALIASGALIYQGNRVISGELSLGDMGQVLAALALIQDPIRRLNGVHLRIMQGVASARRLFEIKDAPVEMDSLARPAAHTRTSSVTVEFQDARFSYVEGHPVLSGASFKLSSGEWLGIRGPSGSGKSTIAHLIPRFYMLNSGKILMNGQDIEKMDVEDLRSHISLVSQDVFLFHDTVYRNILMGRPSATPEDVKRAAISAFAHDFISQLPQGYDTVVGDRGCKLSGGQRQRVSIARALLKDAPLVILDEATSALDKSSEAEVQKALEELMKGRTVLIISHQESAFARAHRVLQMKDGKLQ